MVKMTANGVQRRGFLAFLGVGAVAGPNLAREAVQGHTSIQGLAKSSLAEFARTNRGSDKDDESLFEEMPDDDDDEDSVFRRVFKRVRRKAQRDFVLNHGLHESTIIDLVNKAEDLVLQGKYPPHIQQLKSFSETRKQQLSREHYRLLFVRNAYIAELSSLNSDDYYSRRDRFIKPLLKMVEKKYKNSENELYSSKDSVGSNRSVKTRSSW